MIKVSKKVFEGMECVRTSGATNMLDVPAVIRYSKMLGYPETASWISKNPKEYANGVFMGFEVTSD